MEPVIATTPSQYAFVVCLMLVAPFLGICAAMVQRARGENAWGGFLWVTGAGWFTGFMARALRHDLYPKYPVREFMHAQRQLGDEVVPTSQPAEWVAMLFVAPTLVACLATLRWLMTRRPVKTPLSTQTKRRLALSALAAGLLASLLIVRDIEGSTWPAHRHLPEEATFIEETAIEDWFLGDFDYVIRAEMSEEVFRVWMGRMGVDKSGGDAQQEAQCGKAGSYHEGVGTFSAWCR